jgi:hypothetical protein
MEQSRLPALIFDRVVEKRCNRLILAPAVLEHERRDAEQVRYVRQVRPLPGLYPVELGCELQGRVKSRP